MHRLLTQRFQLGLFLRPSTTTSFSLHLSLRSLNLPHLYCPLHSVQTLPQCHPLRSFSTSCTSAADWSPAQQRPQPHIQITQTNNTNQTGKSTVTREDLVHLSHLSYLPYPKDDTKLVSDIRSLIGWFDSITELDMSQHQPMYTPLEVKEYYHVVESSKPPSSTTTPSASSAPVTASPSVETWMGTRLRPDVVTEGGLEKSVLANAPYKDRGFFVVPKSGRTDIEE